MKQLFLICVVVALVGCGTTSWVSDSNNPNNVKIEAAIRKELKKPAGELTKVDLEKVTKLDLKQNELTDVKGLENLTQLQNLHLDWNKLTNEDLKPLTGLTNLRWLGLGGIPPLGDLTPLGGLAKLEQLQLAYDRLTNISSLSRLKELKTIDLSATSLTDEQLEHLSGLTKLTALDLRQNRLTDVSALAGLTQLAYLTLNDNQLTDASPLMTLKKLKRLNLNNNSELTKVQIDELQKALPNCIIISNPTK